MAATSSFLKNTIGSSVLALSGALLVSACASLSESSVDPASASAAAATAEDSGEMNEMHAKCMVMHEEMKAKMADGGMKMGEGAMSPEMKEMHEQCMEAMPEMHKKCTQMKKEGKEGMGEHCKAIMHGSKAHEHEDGADQ